VLPFAEACEGGEEPLVLRSRGRRRRPVRPIRYCADLQEIKEVSGQDQLHRSLFARQIVEEVFQLLGRLEPVAPRITPDVRVRDEDDQGIAAKFEHL
jgi:hypothetical protein